MLIIKPRCRRIQYQHGGCGIFDSIGRKLFSTGVKNAINTAAKSAITHKVANAVVNGATSAAEKAVNNAVTDTINHIKPHITGKKRKVEETKSTVADSQQTLQDSKKQKLIDSLINGSGIVLD